MKEPQQEAEKLFGEDTLFDTTELQGVTNVSAGTAQGQREIYKPVYIPRLELTEAERWTPAREAAAQERARRIHEATQEKLRREAEQASEKAKQDAIDAELFRQSLFGESGKYRGMQERYEKWKAEKG